MISKRIQFIGALIGTAILCVFIIGLAVSISTGFAGFWGGLPFTVIIIAVLSLAVYDFWDETIRNKDDK